MDKHPLFLPVMVVLIILLCLLVVILLYVGIFRPEVLKPYNGKRTEDERDEEEDETTEAKVSPDDS